MVIVRQERQEMEGRGQRKCHVQQSYKEELMSQSEKVNGAQGL